MELDPDEVLPVEADEVTHTGSPAPPARRGQYDPTGALILTSVALPQRRRRSARTTGSCSQRLEEEG
jgi:hypothetical protein